MSYQVGIEKSVARILGTPLGSRVMRPNFGSRLHELIDKRPDDGWRLDFTHYAYEAITKPEPDGEPRVTFVGVQFVSVDSVGGVIQPLIQLKVKETGETLEVDYAA